MKGNNNLQQRATNNWQRYLTAMFVVVSLGVTQNVVAAPPAYDADDIEWNTDNLFQGSGQHVISLRGFGEENLGGQAPLTVSLPSGNTISCSGGGSDCPEPNSLTVATNGVCLSISYSGSFSSLPTSGFYLLPPIDIANAEGSITLPNLELLVNTNAPAVATNCAYTAPTAGPDTATVASSAAGGTTSNNLLDLIDSNDLDADGDITYFHDVIDAPSNGTVDVEFEEGYAASVTYTPDEGFTGTDQFTYNALDSTFPASFSNTATVTLTVTNEAPALSFSASFDGNSQPPTLTINEGESGSVLASATDRENGTLAFSYVGLPGFCTTSDLSNGSADITCDPGFSDQGTYNVDVTVTDNGVPAANDSQSFQLNIVDQTQPTVQMLNATQTVAENIGNAQVVVTRNGGTSGNISVDYSVVAGTATAGGDYTAVSGTLTWSGIDTSNRTIAVPVFDDAFYEPGSDQTFDVILSNPNSSDFSLGTPTTTTVSITDNNVQPQVSLSSASLDTSEPNASVDLTVTRTGDQLESGDVTVDYVSANGTATAGADYTAVNATLTWVGADASNRTITVPLLDDGLFEGATAETFTVTLQQAAAGVAITPTAVATVNVADDELQAQIDFNPIAYSVNEPDGTVDLTVTRSGASGGAISVPYTTTDGTATAGTDFIQTQGTLDWPDGDTSSRTITVPIIDDRLFESGANEQFTVNLSNLTGSAILGADSATVTIGDNEQPTALQFTLSEQTVGEAAGTVSVDVTRLNATDGAVSIDFATADGSAEAGTDYTAQTGSLNWASGDSAPKQIQLAITDDGLFEGDEALSITLTNPTGGAQVGTPDVIQINITDNEATPTLSFEVDAVTVNETDASVTLNVTRTIATDETISVEYATSDGSAVTGEDYVASLGTLTWASGDTTTQQVVVPLLDDVEFDGDAPETFTLTLANPSAPGVLGAQSTATISINDNESTPTLSPGAGSITASETAGTATISIARTGAPSGAISVDFASADGTALAGSDYGQTSGTLTWADGDLDPKDIVLTLVNDTDFEGSTDETFVVNLSNPSAGIALDGEQVEIAITDDETPPAVNFEVAETTVNESAGTATFTVNRTGPSNADSSVDFQTVAGTAIAGEDFTASSGSLNWAGGDTSAKEIVITIISDAVFENPIEESLTVELSNPVGADLGTNIVATLTIREDGISAGDGSGIAGQDILVRVDDDTGLGVFQLEAIQSNNFSNYEWSLDGAVVGDTPMIPQAMAPGEYTYTLKVLDGNGQTLTDSVNADVTRELVQEADRLQDLEGLTGNQRSVATAVDSICGRLNTRATLTADQDDLRERCSQIILNDDNGEKIQALDAIGGRQITSQMTTILEIGSLQFRNIAERQRRIRQSGRGDSLAGLNINVKGHQLPTEALSGLVDFLTGGNAGDSDFGRLAFFLSGNLSFGEQDETDAETGFDFNTSGITAGFDYRFTDKLFGGVAIGYGRGDADFDRNVGNLDTEVWSGTLFGNYATDNYYVDGLVGVGFSDHDAKRQIRYNDATGLVQRTAKGNTDGLQWSVGFETGLNLNKGGWLFNPNISAYYTDVSIDSFAESGASGLNLRYDDQDGESMTVSGGLSLSYTFNTEKFVLIPQLRIDYVTELENDGQVINVRFLNDPFANDPTNPSSAISIRTEDADDGYVTIGLGVSAQFVNGISGFVDWQTVQSYDDLDVDSLSFGLRWERLF